MVIEGGSFTAPGGGGPLEAMHSLILLSVKYGVYSVCFLRWIVAWRKIPEPTKNGGIIVVFMTKLDHFDDSSTI